MAERKKAYYVVSTHWDREWYEPFQHYRYHLIQVIDEVLDTLKSDSRFSCFQTDGQSSLVEDYLAIRPEREEQVREYAANGKLRIGPWYTMPDENLPAPESLIRNLEEGIRVSKNYGNVSRAGFICDIFGHVSQIPQIFRNFGIPSAFLFRGVNEDTHGGLFLWAGPDDSELVTSCFGPKDGYFDYGGCVRNAFDHAVPYSLEDAITRIVEYVKVQENRAEADTILLFDGGDHMPIEPTTPDILEALRKARPDLEIIHAGLEEYAESVISQKEKIKHRAVGELHAPGRLMNGTWLIPGVLSSRIRQTQNNRARETELCFWAEPFSHLAGKLTGLEYPNAFLRKSWRYLLKNHAHDSICGCSPDQVHRDMDYRYDQSRLINAKMITCATEAIAFRVNTPELEGEEFALAVFNPTQAELNQPIDVELWFDENTKNTYGEFFGYEKKIGFRLYDLEGNEIAYDYLQYCPQRRRFHRPWGKTCIGQECIVVTVTLKLKIPAFGYTTLICKPEAKPTRHPTGGIVAGDRALENQFLRVAVSDNGSLSLLDKRSGEKYERLLVFEDRADIGDGWFHGIAVNDRICSSTACSADVEIVADGAYKGTIRIVNRMIIPECFEFDRRMRRSGKTITQEIESFVTLRDGCDYLEIKTVIDNQARDHRIRVLFESNATTDSYQSDSAFDIIDRKIGLPADNHTYKELAVETTPQATWTAVFDDSRGLAVIAPDLPETAVRDVPEHTLALTLLRGYVRTIFTDGEEDCQSLGRHEFNYRLAPTNGVPNYQQLTQLAQSTAAGVRTAQVLRRDQKLIPQRNLPGTYGQLTVTPGKAILSSLRRHPEKNHLELRIFNPTTSEMTEKLAFTEPISSAELTDFEGNVIETIPVMPGNSLVVNIAPKRIITIAIACNMQP